MPAGVGSTCKVADGCNARRDNGVTDGGWVSVEVAWAGSDDGCAFSAPATKLEKKTRMQKKNADFNRDITLPPTPKDTYPRCAAKVADLQPSLRGYQSVLLPFHWQYRRGMLRMGGPRMAEPIHVVFENKKGRPQPTPSTSKSSNDPLRPSCSPVVNAFPFRVK